VKRRVRGKQEKQVESLEYLGPLNIQHQSGGGGKYETLVWLTLSTIRVAPCVGGGKKLTPWPESGCHLTEGGGVEVRKTKKKKKEEKKKKQTQGPRRGGGGTGMAIENQRVAL